MAYTPELSYENSCNLRRLAWFLGKPMTKTLETLIELLSVRMAEIKPGEVGETCRDRTKCETCAFNPEQFREKAAGGEWCLVRTTLSNNPGYHTYGNDRHPSKKGGVSTG